MKNWMLIVIGISALTLTGALLSIDHDQTDKNIAKYKKCQEAGMVMLQSVGGTFECYPPSALEKTETAP